MHMNFDMYICAFKASLNFSVVDDLMKNRNKNEKQ